MLENREILNVLFPEMFDPAYLVLGVPTLYSAY